MFPFKSSTAAPAAATFSQPFSAGSASWGMPFAPSAASLPMSAPSAYGAMQPLANAARGMMPFQQISGLAGQTAGGGSQILGMIGKIQNVIQTANRVMPMVQQHGQWSEMYPL